MGLTTELMIQGKRLARAIAIVLLFAAVPHKALAQSMALALSWKGYADTDLRFSEFFGGDHTIVLRFMPQFPNAYEGPFLGENGIGKFGIGQGDFNAGTIGTKLFLAVGSGYQTYSASLQAGQWHHVAVVARSSAAGRSFAVYLNGSQLGPPLIVASNDPQMPNGTVRLGKRTTGQTVNGHNGQFYGLLDDVAFFSYALTASEIQNLAINVRQMTGYETGLLYGYTFNDGTQSYRLSRPVALNGGARRVPVSTDRNNVDAAALPLPTQQTEMTLPFPPGEAWNVIQGTDDATGSHRGYASFCWDFVPDAEQAAGAPFYAAGPGLVTRVIQSGVSGTGNRPNLVEVMQAPGEIAAYLHLQQNGAAVSSGDAVSRGQKLALTGDTGCNCGSHLHFATSDMPDQTPGFVTYPIAFSNYEVRDAVGTWSRVLRGMPKAGQVIRVPSDPSARYNAVWRPDTTPEIQMEGATYQDYRSGYDQIWPEGWRLHTLQSYVLNGQVLYNAVWRPGTFSEIQVYGWTYADYRKKYDELWPQGWRLFILQSYVLSGQVLYNAVWRPDTSGEIQVYGWTYQDYRNLYDSMWPQGWRLYILQSYVLNGQVLYNAVWRPGTSGEIQVYGWTYADYRKKYDELWPQGWRLFILQSYVLSGQVLYNAVWRPSTSGEVQVYGWTYVDFRKKYDELSAQGWRLDLLDAYQP